MSLPKLSLLRPNRQQRYRMLSSGITMMVVIALILCNLTLSVIDSRSSLDLDLTSDQVFQLTQESKDYLAQLEDPVSLTVLNSKEDFLANGDYYKQVASILEDYERASDNITLTYADVLRNPSLVSQYDDLSLTINSIIVESGTQRRVLSAYDLFNIESSYYGSTITSSKAEQALTSAILGVTSDDLPQVAFLTGHGEYDSSAFSQLLEQNNYQVSTLNPATDVILEDIDVLLMVCPTNDPDQDVLDRISDFLSLEGKSLLYFADSSQPDLPRLSAFLEEWGIQVGDGLLVETDSQKIINFNPYFFTTTLSDTSLTSSMSDTSIPLSTPYCRPLTALYEQSLGRTTTVLLQSSETAALVPPDVPEDWSLTDEDMVGSVPIAIRSTYTFDSGETSQVLAYGSTSAILDSLLESGSFSNSDYFLSVMNTLCQRDDTITIQPKSLTRELGLNTSQQFLLGAVFMVVVPVTAFVLGITIWLRRRRL